MVTLFIAVVLFMSMVRMSFDLSRGIYPKDDVERVIGLIAAAVNGAMVLWATVLLWRMA